MWLTNKKRRSVGGDTEGAGPPEGERNADSEIEGFRVEDHAKRDNRHRAACFCDLSVCSCCTLHYQSQTLRQRLFI